MFTYGIVSLVNMRIFFLMLMKVNFCGVVMMIVVVMGMIWYSVN